MTELLKSCRNKLYRRTLPGPMERSRRGYNFTDLEPYLTDPFGRLRHLRPPPPPPVILHPQFMPSVRSPSISAPRGQSCPATSKSQRTRRSIYSTDHSRDEELHSPGRSSKRSRTASASAPRRSRRPFTVFPSKRAGRPSLSPTANCKHYCHAILRNGRKCLSPCDRRRQDITIAGVHDINGGEA